MLQKSLCNPVIFVISVCSPSSHTNLNACPPGPIAVLLDISHPRLRRLLYPTLASILYTVRSSIPDNETNLEAFNLKSHLYSNVYKNFTLTADVLWLLPVTETKSISVASCACYQKFTCCNSSQTVNSLGQWPSSCCTAEDYSGEQDMGSQKPYSLK